MSQFEIVLEESDSTTRVLHRQGDQTLEDVLVDLQNFSGKLRIRRVTAPLHQSDCDQHTSTSVNAPGQQNPTLESAYSSTEFQKQIPNPPSPSTGHQPLPAAGLGKPSIENDRDFSLSSQVPKDSDQQEMSPSTLLPSSTPSSSSTESKKEAIPVVSPTYQESTDYGAIPNHGRRRRMSKRTSMRELTQLESFSDTQGQTIMHRLCASQAIDFRRLHDLVERNTQMVKQPDAKGRLPLHILGNNSELISFTEGQKTATKCALLLMDAYPDGIVTADADGRMPFTYLILKWVEWTFDQEQHNCKQSSVSCSPSLYGVSAVISKFNRTLHSMHSMAGSSADGRKTNDTPGMNEMVASGGMECPGKPILESLQDSLSKSTNRFPPVMIFDEVEWSFEMLSYGMEHLGGKPLDPSKKVRPTLAYKKQREQRDALARNIAEIPGLLRSVLLIESKQTRSFILECSAIRRSLLCSSMVGPWLTCMIRYKKGYSSKVALNFLQTLSKLNADDFTGGYRKALPDDEKEFLAAKLEVYKAVEKIGDMIPTLLIAGERATNQAVTTPLICFIMNRQMATPFTVGTGVGECLLHVTAMFAFRQRLLQLYAEEKMFLHFPWMTLNSVIFWVAMNQLVFKFCEYIALSHISQSSARKVAFGWWSMIEIIGIVLALWAAIWTEKINHNEVDRVFIMAVIVGLLWIRILSFLKVVNEQLATFILALRQMIYDIRFFSLVLFVFVLMFGDMFHLIVRNKNDIDCSAEDIDPAIEEFCSPRSFDAYLRTYAIVVGDFELEQYNDLGPVTFLWFCTTFLGTVVMLNVLIAVVTISYANSQESSLILFRRARAQFLASHSVMERFIRPAQSRWSDKMSTTSLTYASLIFLRWILLLTFVTTTVWSSLYIIELASFSIREQRFAFTGPLIILAVLMACQLCCAVSFLLTILIEQVIPRGKLQDFLLTQVNKQTERIMKKVMSNLYGTDRKDTEGGEVTVSRNADVLARLDRLENLLHQVIAKQARKEDEELEVHFNDVPLVFLPETDELDPRAVKG